MWIDVYINDQHLHSFSNEMAQLPDVKNMRFKSLQKKMEFRENIINLFVTNVCNILRQNNIIHYEMYIRLSSSMPYEGMINEDN